MIRSPLLTALFHPINLLMLVLTVSAGLCSAWWLAPVGFLLWLGMVWAIARSPGLRMTFTRQNRQPLAQRYQNRFDRLDRARISVFNALERSGSAVRSVAEPVVSSLDELVETAYQLSLRLSAVDNTFVVQKLTNNFTDDIAKMEKNLTETSHPDSRKEFTATLQSLRQRQEQLEAIATLLSRFEAQLTGTTNAVDSVVTGIVGLQGRSAKQAGEKIPALVQILETELSELVQFNIEIEKSSLL